MDGVEPTGPIEGTPDTGEGGGEQDAHVDASPAPAEPPPSLSRLMAREAELRRREETIRANEGRLGDVDVDELVSALENGDPEAILSALKRDPKDAYMALTQKWTAPPEDEPVTQLRGQLEALQKQLEGLQMVHERTASERAVHAEQARLAEYITRAAPSHPLVSAALAGGAGDAATIAVDLHSIKAEHHAMTKNVLDDSEAMGHLERRLEGLLQLADKIRSAAPRTPDPVGETAAADTGHQKSGPAVPSRRSAGSETAPAARTLTLKERVDQVRQRERAGRYNRS